MLTSRSDQIADSVEGVAPSVVQVQGHRRPASGLAYAPEHVLTTARAVGREEHPRVQRHDGEVLGAEIAGWDPVTRLVLLSVPGLNGSAPALAESARVGQIAIAVARSWSNAVTATLGLVSVIGGPLPTGRRRAIEQVIRTSAPMHEGFAGGALVDPDGRLLGIATAYRIRGLGVVIPAQIAWSAAGALLEGRSMKRGYLGISAQPARVTETQRSAVERDDALLITSVKEGTPAAEGGLLVGDLVVSLDGQPVTSPDELLDLLVGDRVGKTVGVRVVRGSVPIDVTVTVAERR